MNSRSRCMSKQYCVWMNCAPASTFFFSRATRISSGSEEGFSAAPRKMFGADLMAAAGQVAFLVAHRSQHREQGNAVEVEYRSRLRMIAGLDAVSCQTKNIGDAEGRGAQDVALNGDAVAVAAGYLHDRAMAFALQEQADRQARYVDIGAGRVGRIDAVDVTVETADPLIDIRRVGGVRRRHLRGDHKLTVPQQSFERRCRFVRCFGRCRV